VSAPDDAGAAALLERLRRGDGAAFDSVYEQHKDEVWRFLMRLGRRRELAEDLFQETWLRLARHAHELAADTNVRAWLYAVARNLHRSHVRWAVLDERARTALARWWYLDQAPLRADARVDAAGALGRLRSAFDALPAAHREVLVLAVGEDLSSVDVAKALSLSHDAARQRLSRARAALAAALEAPAGAGAREREIETQATQAADAEVEKESERLHVR
jgi:RNA polymerase sigma factor (sigma-70 family)